MMMMMVVVATLMSVAGNGNNSTWYYVSEIYDEKHQVVDGDDGSLLSKSGASGRVL